MAADTYSPSVGAIEQGTGNNNNSWGVNLNGALTALDKAIAGYVEFSVTGGTLLKDDVVPPAGEHPLVQSIVNFSGVLASHQIVQVPNVSKTWLVENACSGAFTLKFKTTSGAASVAIPQNGQALVICDGNDGMFVGLSTSLRDVQWLGADGTLALPGVSFANEPGLGFRRVSAGVLAITVGGTDIITISGSTVTLSSTVSSNIIPAGTEANHAGIREPDGWYFEFGQTKVRATDQTLMNAITETFTADTNNTTTLSNVSKDLRNLGLEGSVLEGTGIFTGATIVSIAATSIVMSAAATNTAAGGGVRAFPHGNGDGSNTFTIPDARGTVPAGRDDMGGTAAGRLTTAGSGVNGLRLKTIGGAQNITLDTTQIPAHTHANSLNEVAHSHSYSGSAVYTFLQNSGSSLPVPTGSSTTSANVTGITITNASVGGGGAHGNVQPTRIRNVIIKR